MYPELLTLGPITVYTYGVLLAAAYLLGLRLATSRAKARGIDPNRALDLGIAGAITQVALAYTPIVGDICSIRDMVGDIYHRDKLGFLLSMLALVPVLGGIAKTIDVIHNTRRVGHALVRSRQRHGQEHPRVMH